MVRQTDRQAETDNVIFNLKLAYSLTTVYFLQVWGEASAQAFASLTLGGGGWITLSSYNKFKNKCNRYQKLLTNYINKLSCSVMFNRSYCDVNLLSANGSYCDINLLSANGSY